MKIEAALSIALLLIIGAIAFAVNSWQCSSQWADSGLQSSFKLGSGCRVKLPDGRWLPADRVREVEIAPKDAQ